MLGNMIVRCKSTQSSVFIYLLCFLNLQSLFQYEEYGEDFVDMLDGMFSFVLLDTRNNSFIAARDAIGITPLYMGWGLDGMLLLTASSYF